ncbi:hypothetical protein GOP47_0015641, partial [Adiantum capillus-veneris]
MKLSRNRSIINQGSNQERASDGAIRSSVGLFRLILHSLLCVAALVLGFRLSGETRLVVISIKPAHSTFISNSITRFYRARSFGALPGAPYVIDDKRDITPIVSESTPSAKSAARTTAALWSAGTQAVWIVVEAGGVSNGTVELLSQSRLSYYHLAVQEPMPANSKDREQLEIQLRLEGLRFVRNLQLDGVVIFLDESNTFNLDLFEAVQKIDWFGTFTVGLLFHSELPLVSEENIELVHNFSIASIESKSKIEVGDTGMTEESNIYKKNGHSPSVKEDLMSGSSLPVKGPVCNPEGHLVGWYVPSSNKHFEWAGFALNSRMLWEDVSKPSWIKSWDEVFRENSPMPESPLAFLRNNSYIEPLGDCGRNILMWWIGVEAAEGCKFPSRWIISPPLEVVVPSRQTPWPNITLV